MSLIPEQVLCIFSGVSQGAQVSEMLYRIKLHTFKGVTTDNAMGLFRALVQVICMKGHVSVFSHTFMTMGCIGSWNILGTRGPKVHF